MTDYERIYAVMNSKGFSQPSKFAAECGIPAQNIYDIKSGKCRITKRVTDMVVARYPDVDGIWLLTGSGVIPDLSQMPCNNCGINDECRELLRTQAELIATQKELIASLREQITMLKNNGYKK